MSIISFQDRIVIFGGAGFLGTYLVKELAKTHAKIIIVSKNTESNKSIKLAGSVGQISFIKVNTKDKKAIDDIVQYATCVINLIGIMSETKANKFIDAHVNIPMAIAKACNKHNIKTLIHVSALGIQKIKNSNYASSKFEGERLVIQELPSATIVRPSALFGAEDNFTNTLNMISKSSPFVPLIGGGNSKIQPIYVCDVAKALTKILSIDLSDRAGKIFELGGPKILTLRSITNKILHCSNRKKTFITIPFSIAKLIAMLLQLLNARLLTLDQVELLEYDNILYGENGLKLLGITPTPLEAVLPMYID